MSKTKMHSARYRRILQHRLSIILISCVVVVLSGVLYVASSSLRKKNENYKAQEMELEKQLEEANAQSEEIDEREEYVGSDKYIEDVAKDKLGLVYPNEILFQAEP
jgi:cell division protein DivIC